MQSNAAGQVEAAGIGWQAVGAALGASLVGIGLARFAYTPLVPALVTAHWFTPSEAAYLGAANLAGYLLGALAGRFMAARWQVAWVLRAMMALATVTFFAGALPLGFLWLFVWRLASGLAGGALMVLAAPAVLPGVPAHRRGVAGGVIFTGVGIGIASSGLLIPPMLRLGLPATWVGLGLLSLLLTLATWRFWPDAPAAQPSPPHKEHRVPVLGRTRMALTFGYGLNAVGLVPHMLFLADFVARGRGFGIGTAALVWVAFGIGALCGPLILGALADRIGFRLALRAGFLIQAAFVLLVLAPAGLPAILLSSLVVGAFVPGIVPLVLGRLHELVRDVRHHHAAWSTATVAFAIGQAAAAYGGSYLFARTGSDTSLYLGAALALLLALSIDLAASPSGRAAG
jgi:predicted MFS family arabinose efflux permease